MNVAIRWCNTQYLSHPSFAPPCGLAFVHSCVNHKVKSICSINIYCRTLSKESFYARFNSGTTLNIDTVHNAPAIFN